MREEYITVNCGCVFISKYTKIFGKRSSVHNIVPLNLDALLTMSTMLFFVLIVKIILSIILSFQVKLAWF
jgi:hypothetical protein